MLNSKLSKQILNKLHKSNTDFSDLFFEKRQGTNISFENKKLRNLTTTNSQGLGLRAIENLATSYAYTNILDTNHLLDIAANLSHNLSGKTTNQSLNFSIIKPNKTFIDTTSQQEVPHENKITLCQQANDLAWSLDPRVTQVTIHYSEQQRETLLFNSLGEQTENNQNLIVLHFHVTVKDKKDIFATHDVLAAQAGFNFLTQNKIDDLVKKTVNRALLNFQAKPFSGGKLPVVLASDAGGTIIHEAVGHALEADLVLNNLSVFADKKDHLIANPLVTVVDDATLDEKRGSFSFDDEGIPGQRTTLIEKGILKGFLCDRLSAKRLHCEPTGNGRRESYEHRPITRMTNTMLLPGKDKPEDVIKSLHKGLLVKKMGGGQVDTVNGDFVFHVQEGYLVENGKISDPVKNITISGNGPQVIKDIEMIASDLDFASGTCGKHSQYSPVTHAIPTMRVKELIVG
jgi:TldD protein